MSWAESAANIRSITDRGEIRKVRVPGDASGTGKPQGGSVAMDAPRQTDARRARVWALAAALTSRGCRVQVAESEPVVVVMASSGSPVVIRCRSRDDGDGESWFCVAGGGPALARADDEHLQEAVRAVKRYLSDRAGTGMGSA
jgi:hypothetical protein